MTITFLGTGTSQGVPVIACDCAICTSPDLRDNRTRTSVMVEDAGKKVIIDTGPDFRAQMLREKVKSIDGIVFTHEHKDHIAGLDEVRAFNYFNKWRAQVYCTRRVEEALRREFAYAFADFRYPGIPEIDLIEIDESSFQVEGIPFQPIPLMHLHLPVFGYRIHDFTYITDANFISDESKDLVRNSKVLVLNALRLEKHPSHFNLSEALELIEELQPERAYLTHISHQLGKHEDVSKELPDHVELAWDGLKLELA
ncbi:MAG: MBL fold metallo-hydrolase [Flavobacteriales bacterium]